MQSVIRHVTVNDKALVMLSDENGKTYTVQLYKIPNYANELTVQETVYIVELNTYFSAIWVFNDLRKYIGAAPKTIDFGKE